MNKVLLAVDGSECSDRAVRWTISVISAMNRPARLDVVTVQPAINAGGILEVELVCLVIRRDHGDAARA